MFKFVALAAAVAVAQGGLLAAPLAYASAPIVSSSAITTRSDGYTLAAAPVVHTLAAAPVVKTLAAAPIAATYAAAPIATYAASPVVASSAITSRTDSYNPIVAQYAAPIAATYAAAPLAARLASPIAYSAGYGISGLRVL